MNEERPNYDGRVFGKNGESDYFVAGNFWPKLGFVLFSFAILFFGIWQIWEPANFYFFGEKEEARVVRIVRTEAGQPDQTIRIRREFKEQGSTVTFRHFVEVIQKDGTPTVLELAVASRNQPIAKVNDEFTVMYKLDGEYAFQLAAFRTWSFGVGFSALGAILVLLSTYTLYCVGKRIYIDPESEEAIEQERQNEANDREYKRKLAELKQQ